MQESTTQDLKKIFDEFDLDKNGTISLSELSAVSEKLGHPLQEKQRDKIVQLLDTNQDGKISFEQFEYWWAKGHRGKMGQLVMLKAQAMKLTNFIKKQFHSANISLQNHKGNPKADHFDIKVQFGEAKEGCVKVCCSLAMGGECEKQLKEKVKAKLTNCESFTLTDNTYGFILCLPSKDPSTAKAVFEQNLNQIFKEGPYQSIHDNPVFSYNGHVSETQFIITVTLREEIEKAMRPIITASQEVKAKIGQGFYSSVNIDLSVNSSVDDMLDKNISESLMSGFCMKVYGEANNSSIGKVRKLAESKLGEMPPMLNLFTLIRSKKFHMKIKTPEQLSKFLKSMGIAEAVEGLPVFADLFEQFSSQLCEEKQNDQKLKMIYKICNYGLKHVENNISLFLLGGMMGCGHLQIDAKNATRIHSILFNEV